MITRLITRRKAKTVSECLEKSPAVMLLGPRQVGKTTLAMKVINQRGGIYLDLEDSSVREKMSDPAQYFLGKEDKLVVLDEIQRLPDLLMDLRGVIDKGRATNKANGRFLILGSAAPSLLRQSSESLAGRIAHVELSPFDVLELEKSEQLDLLWVRGGFPESFLAASDSDSLFWRNNFNKTYMERDIPALGMRIPADTLRRFWTMLAHAQGQLLNAAQLSRSLAVSGKTVTRYLDLLVDLLLVRRLEPYHANVRKRLTKSPRIYLRDSGMVHALLGLESKEDLLGHQVAGGSWEGFVIENILRVVPQNTAATFYRTVVGAEIDLVLEIPRVGLWAIEIKRGYKPRLARGFHHAREDIEPVRSFVVYSGIERYFKAEGVEAIGLAELCHELAALA